MTTKLSLKTNNSSIQTEPVAAVQEALDPSAVKAGAVTLPVFSAASAKSLTLFEACETGAVKEIRSLLQSPSTDVDALDQYGMGPMHYACFGGNIDALRVLLIHGGRHLLNITNGSGETPLRFATALALSEKDPIKKKQLLEVVRFLLQQGANPNDRDALGMSCLHAACDSRSLEMAQLALSFGADIEARDASQNTPLILAACTGDQSTIDLLLGRGADVNAMNSEKVTPLSAACFSNREQQALAFLERGARPNDGAYLKGVIRLPPLHLACVNGNLNLAKALEKAGADLSLIFRNSREEHTPFTSACSRPDNDEVIEWLKKRGARTEIVSHSGDLYSQCVAQSPRYVKHFKRPEDARLLATKKVALSNDIANQPGSAISYEGWEAPIFYSDIAKLLKESDLEDVVPKKELLQAYEQASRVRSPEVLAAQIRRGELVVIPAGWLGHAVTLIFYRGYYAICNRGEGVEGHSSAEFYRLNTQQITTQAISEILRIHKNGHRMEGRKYIYDTLPQKFAPKGDGRAEQDAFCHEMRRKMASSLQTVGNCPFASSAGSVACSMALLANGKAHGKLTSETAHSIKKNCDLGIVILRLRYLESYLELHPDGENAYVAKESWKNLKKLVKQNAISLDAYPEIRKRLHEPETRPFYKKAVAHLEKGISRVQESACHIAARVTDAVIAPLGNVFVYS
jgi:ankyrin repeat protein